MSKYKITLPAAAVPAAHSGSGVGGAQWQWWRLYVATGFLMNEVVAAAAAHPQLPLVAPRHLVTQACQMRAPMRRAL